MFENPETPSNLADYQPQHIAPKYALQDSSKP